jgi:RimJ/RimL family protein N-acetyltransferase
MAGTMIVMDTGRRVTIELVETRAEALAIAVQLPPHDIQSMQVVAGGLGIGYVIRWLAGGDDILGWGHARLMGDHAEFGWETHPSHKGHRYTQEAAPLFMAEVLRRPGVTQAYAYITETNTASERVVIACGMALTDAPIGPGRTWLYREPRAS